MPAVNINPNLEELRVLALRPQDEIPSGPRVDWNHTGIDFYVDYGDGLEVIRQGEGAYIRGVLGDITVGDMGEGTVVTISFEGGTDEPTSFLRWDKTREDTNEGYSIPKRQRAKIAAHLVERFAA